MEKKMFAYFEEFEKGLKTAMERCDNIVQKSPDPDDKRSMSNVKTALMTIGGAHSKARMVAFGDKKSD